MGINFRWRSTRLTQRVPPLVSDVGARQLDRHHTMTSACVHQGNPQKTAEAMVEEPRSSTVCDGFVRTGATRCRCSWASRLPVFERSAPRPTCSAGRSRTL